MACNIVFVICMSVHAGAVAYSYHEFHYGEAADDTVIWLDELDCRGYESSLIDCTANELGVHDCTHVEDSSVICLINTSTGGVLLHT